MASERRRTPSRMPKGEGGPRVRSRSRKDTAAPHVPSQRQLRVGEEIRHLLSSFFTKGEIRDDTLWKTPVTVTEVRISADFSHATAFVCPLGGGDLDDIVHRLNLSAKEIRLYLGRHLKLKVTPEVKFIADLSFDAAGKMNELFQNPLIKRDLGQ